MLLLVFLSCAYLSKEAQSETLAAEKIVGFHNKRLQQVNDFEPVRFLPARLVRLHPQHFILNIINILVSVRMHPVIMQQCYIPFR